VSYFRANGRFSGRVCSGGKRVCADASGGYSLGDIATTASSSGFQSDIEGDPVVALIAQLNRFAGKSFTPGGTPVRSGGFPLNAGLSDAVTTAATILVYNRYEYVPHEFYTVSKAAWANAGLSDTIKFVSENLREIVVTIAEYGDKVGLPPAKVGITKRVLPSAKLDFRLLAVAGGLMALAFVVAGRK